MTAPLPPLPYWMVHTLSAAEQADVAAHAKLAVRQALQYLVGKSIVNEWIEPSEDGAIYTIQAETIHAMIEEYKND